MAAMRVPTAKRPAVSATEETEQYIERFKEMYARGYWSHDHFAKAVERELKVRQTLEGNNAQFFDRFDARRLTI